MAKLIFIAWWRYDQLTESNQVKSRHRNDLINVNGVALMSFWSMFIKFNRLFRRSSSQPKTCDFATKETPVREFSFEFCKVFQNSFCCCRCCCKTPPGNCFYQFQCLYRVEFKHGFSCYVRFYKQHTLVRIFYIEELVT